MSFYDFANLGPDAFLLRITDWPLFLKCRQHSCSNAIVWATKLINGELSDFKDPYISTESLRNTTSELLDHVPQFVRSFTFTAIRSGAFEERVRFWRTLEVEGKMIEDVAYIDTFWEHNRLVCNNDLEYDDNLFEKLEAIVAYSLQFSNQFRRPLGQILQIFA